jgi:hypothetical protein
MTETVYRVKMTIPGYSPDMVMGTYYSRDSALALAGKIARGELALIVECEAKTTTVDDFYGYAKGDD